MACLVALLAATSASWAASMVFDFNALADEAGNTAVQNYMQGVVNLAHPGGTVTVSGAKGEREYTGDSHVVGPVSGSSVTAYTLGDTNGGVFHPAPLDTFIQNDGGTTITIIFSFPIFAVSFDYEIFPDGTCPQQSSSCSPSTSNWPDFTFKADGTTVFHTFGVVPGQSGTFAHSPASGPINNELAPQLLALSGTQLFPQGVTRLDFIDWPVTVGIDNVRVDVPAPPSLVLLIIALAAALPGLRERASRGWRSGRGLVERGSMVEAVTGAPPEARSPRLSTRV